MKIAVASDGKMVAEHFGHCQGFHIFSADGGAIAGGEFVPNPGHKPGFLPVFLHDKGVNVIISGGMGGGAVDLFNEKGIQVVVGASGSSEVAAQNFLQGKLVSTGSVCQEHSHQDSCSTCGD